jgi:hypothetical protein
MQAMLKACKSAMQGHHLVIIVLPTGLTLTAARQGAKAGLSSTHGHSSTGMSITLHVATRLTVIVTGFTLIAASRVPKQG